MVADYEVEDMLPREVVTMDEALTYLTKKDARGKTRAEKISEHFQNFGYPISLGNPSNQLISCESHGCVFRVGVDTVLKTTSDMDEVHLLRLLSDADLIGHPAYPVLTREDQMYSHGKWHSYLMKEIIPLDEVEYVLTGQEVGFIKDSLDDLALTVNTILYTYPKTDPEVWESVRHLYELGQDPALGRLADFLLQALLSNLWLAEDMYTHNVGFPMGEGGEPMFEKGLVVFDLTGEENIRIDPGLGLYIDYMLDAEEGTFL